MLNLSRIRHMNDKLLGLGVRCRNFIGCGILYMRGCQGGRCRLSHRLCAEAFSQQLKGPDAAAYNTYDCIRHMHYHENVLTGVGSALLLPSRKHMGYVP